MTKFCLPPSHCLCGDSINGLDVGSIALGKGLDGESGNGPRSSYIGCNLSISDLENGFGKRSLSVASPIGLVMLVSGNCSKKEDAPRNGFLSLSASIICISGRGLIG